MNDPGLTRSTLTTGACVRLYNISKMHAFPVLAQEKKEWQWLYPASVEAIILCSEEMIQGSKTKYSIQFFSVRNAEKARALIGCCPVQFFTIRTAHPDRSRQHYNRRAPWKNGLSDYYEKSLLSCVLSASVSVQTFAKQITRSRRRKENKIKKIGPIIFFFSG